MRYTPFLDQHGFNITLPDDLPESVVELVDYLLGIIDSSLEELQAKVDWGTWEGRRRKPCPEQPLLLAGRPIGQYHCPSCGMMILAAMSHLSPSAPSDQDPDTPYPLDDYEVEYEQPWPPGYEGDDVGT
jgi:hypothetical protein